MEDARKRLRLLQQEISNGGFEVDDDKLTVNDLLDRYLEAKLISKAATTHDWYLRNFATQIRPVIGSKRLSDLRASHIQALLSNACNKSRTKKKGESLGGQSLRNLLVGIRVALAWGVRRGLVVRNVAKVVDQPSLQHSEPIIVTLPDVRAILTAVDGTELESVVPFALGTGLRRSEVCALILSDINFDDGTVRVQRAAANLRGKVIIKAPKTKRSRRTEFLAPFVIAVLRKHRAEQAARHLALGIENRGIGGVIFDRKNGRAWNPNEISRIFSRIMRKRRLPAIRLHDLRHGFATLQFAAGVPLKVVSSHSAIAPLVSQAPFTSIRSTRQNAMPRMRLKPTSARRWHPLGPHSLNSHGPVRAHAGPVRVH